MSMVLVNSSFSTASIRIVLPLNVVSNANGFWDSSELSPKKTARTNGSGHGYLGYTLQLQGKRVLLVQRTEAFPGSA